jgi:glycosyltransferase involved in cell wall biosynthesis
VSKYRQLLFVNEYPPSTVAGAPVIARQLFRYYDAERMDVICCASWYDDASPTVRATFLPCRHSVIRSYRTKLRPRRFFGPIEATLDCMRLGKIMDTGRRIAKERGVEALFTISYGAEMPHAAYFLSKELGLPLYYFESDRLDAVATCGRARRLIADNRLAFLRSVKKLWLTSPAMVRDFKRLYGVDGDYLFHFVDTAHYQRAASEATALPRDRIRLVYTGSINRMFLQTMKWFCDWVNQGLVIDGRPVELTIFSAACPPSLLGPHVTWPGLVPLEEIPAKLAQAHIAVILVSFTEEQGIMDQIRTSLYTKTVDYLAVGRPVLIVSPPDSAEVDCFGDVSSVVNQLDRAAVVAAIRRLVDDASYVEDLRQKGLELVARRHSLAALQTNFLSHFEKDS